MPRLRISASTDIAVYILPAEQSVPTARQRQAVLRAGGVFADEWARVFVRDKFGAATTHWAKLQERIDRGVGNPCPLLLIGIPASVIYREPLPTARG